MNIALPKSHAEWLQARVDDGTFASLDDAVARIVEERIALEGGDLDWAIDLVEEGRRDIAEGRTLSLEEFRVRNAARLKKLGT